MMVSAVICTALGCVMPVVNHVGLLAFSVPVTATLVVQIKRLFLFTVHLAIKQYIDLGNRIRRLNTFPENLLVSMTRCFGILLSPNRISQTRIEQL